MSLVAPDPQSGHDPLDGLADLLPQVWQDVVMDTVRGVHEAIADRVFGVVPGSAVVRGVHDRIAERVYGLLGAYGKGARIALRGAVKATASARNPQVMESSRTWRFTVAALNGVLGDLLEEEDNPLAIRMALRVGGADVRPTPRGLAAAYPQATGRLAVLVHGLVESEDSWDYKSGETGSVGYPAILEEAGYTPLLVRYNTGRHISDNAADLAGLLDLAVHRWPVPVEEVLLVGHSMGGLVLRGAADIAAMTDMPWAEQVSSCVMLGSPHSGAPLEKLANVGAWLLSIVPEAEPFGDILRRRSAGIKDLRHGYVRRADWHDQDPDGLRSRRPGPMGAPEYEARHHNVGATMGEGDHTSPHTNPLGYILGDLMVRWDSARAAGQAWAAQATITHIAAADHLALLNHPAVAVLLLDLARQGDSRSA